ncbi:hypothetical protein IFM89_009398 [Coptis chinensis]|uniref:Uncharacterized protein n=1 Tax=Coptis chinensis TaxID=261450 RepID=A0A835LAP8_9MAGN|nr:hypothetical protein IFM89_009398 [Coptis chinensis]
MCGIARFKEAGLVGRAPQGTCLGTHGKGPEIKAGGNVIIIKSFFSCFRWSYRSWECRSIARRGLGPTGRAIPTGFKRGSGNLSNVDHMETGSCIPLLLDKERRQSLSEATQFVKDLETWRNRKINPSRKSKRQQRFPLLIVKRALLPS